MFYNFEVAGADNTSSDLEQRIQGSKAYLPTTSKGNENKLTNMANPGLWYTGLVDNCILISRDLELYGQG